MSEWSDEEFERWRESLARGGAEWDQVQALLREDEEAVEMLQDAVTCACRLQHMLEARGGLHAIDAYGYVMSVVTASLARDLVARGITLEGYE